MRRQFALLLTSRVGSVGLQAVLFALLARSLTPATFGLVMATTGVVGLLLVVTSAGMPGLLSRARAVGDDDVVRAGLRLLARTGVASGAVLALAVATCSAAGLLPLPLVLVVVALTIERTTDAVLSVPIADGDMRSSTWPVVVRRLLALAVLGGGLAAGGDALWAYGVGSVLGAAVAEISARRALRIERGPTAPTGQILRQGAPFMLNTLAAQSRMLDTMIVAVVVAPAAAGAYAAASKLVQPTLLLPQTIASVVLPRAARLGSAGSGALVRSLLAASVGAFVLVIPLLVLAEPLVVLVMGPQYAGAGDTLRWLLVGMPFVALSAPFAAMLQGQGRARLAAANGVVFSVVLLVLLVLGAVVAGPEGAAAGLSASFAVRAATLGLAVRGARS